MLLLWIFTKEDSQKCEKSRISLETLGRLREFCSDSNQQCTSLQEDGSREKEKCPSITGRTSELKNPLPSWDSSAKAAQKVCRALALWGVWIACHELSQQVLAQASLCAPVLWCGMVQQNPTDLGLCTDAFNSLVTDVQSGALLSLLSVPPVLMWALKLPTGFLCKNVV